MIRSVKYSAILLTLLVLSCKLENNEHENNTRNEIEDLIIVDKPVSLEKDEYITSVIPNSQNGLRSTKTVDGFEFSLSYEPAELMVLKDYDGKISEESFEKEVRSRNHFLYFTLRIKNTDSKVTELLQHNLTSADEYTERLKYYSFNVQKDLKLQIAGDTVECCLATYERSYSLSPELTVSLAFPLKEQTADAIEKRQLKERLNITFNEKVFNNGMINFSFHPNVVNTIPTLALK